MLDSYTAIKRKLGAGSIAAGIEQLPERLAAVGGDMAKLAQFDLNFYALRKDGEYGSDAAFLINANLEFDRNRERYAANLHPKLPRIPVGFLNRLSS